jgi:hypothetical protein
MNPRYRALTGREPPGQATAGAPTGPPAPTGTLLAAFPRKGPDGVEQELRIVLDAYEGRDYIAVRVWQRDASGAWWPLRGKGLSVRLGEAQGVISALQQAIHLVGKQAEPTPRERPEREAPRRARPRMVEPRHAWDERGSPPTHGHDYDDSY